MRMGQGGRKAVKENGANRKWKPEKGVREKRGRWRRQGLGERKRLGKVTSENSQVPPGHRFLWPNTYKLTPADQNPELQPWATSAQVCAIEHSSLWQNSIREQCCMSTKCMSLCSSTGTSCLGTMGPEADHIRDSRYRRDLSPQCAYLSYPKVKRTLALQQLTNKNTLTPYNLNVWNADSIHRWRPVPLFSNGWVMSF